MWIYKVTAEHNILNNHGKLNYEIKVKEHQVILTISVSEDYKDYDIVNMFVDLTYVSLKLMWILQLNFQEILIKTGWMMADKWVIKSLVGSIEDSYLEIPIVLWRQTMRTFYPKRGWRTTPT